MTTTTSFSEDTINYFPQEAETPPQDVNVVQIFANLFEKRTNELNTLFETKRKELEDRYLAEVEALNKKEREAQTSLHSTYATMLHQLDKHTVFTTTAVAVTTTVAAKQQTSTATTTAMSSSSWSWKTLLWSSSSS